MLPVRADTRIQYRLELVFLYGDSSRHADCDVGEEELSVDGEGHAVAACVGGIADDSGTTFACTFATRPFLSGNVFGVGIGEQRAWIGTVCNHTRGTRSSAGKPQCTSFFTRKLSNRICHISNLSPFHISFPTDIHRTVWNRNDGDKPRIIYPLDGIKTEILNEIFAIKELTNWRSALYRVGWVRIERDKHECSRPI